MLPRLGKNSKSTATFQGTVVDVTEDEIVLVDAIRTGRTEHDTPGLLKPVPYADRLFKDVGVAREDLGAKKVRVPIAEISSITLAEPAGSDGEDRLQRDPH